MLLEIQNMANKIKFTFLMLVACVLTMHAGPLEDAAKAYKDGDYGKAIECYRQIEKSYGTSSALLFNMGQAYTRAGNLGKAMICYQRALQMNPSNGEARENIKYVESRVQDANRAELKGKKISVVAEDPSFFITVKQYITKRHLSNTWSIWSGVTFVLFCICVALYVFTGVVWVRKIGFFGGLTMLGLSVLFLIFAFMGAHASDKRNEGVITEYKIELRSDPSTSAKTVSSPLTQGTVLQIMDTEEGKDGRPEWYKVRLNNDYVGWIRDDNFEPI